MTWRQRSVSFRPFRFATRRAPGGVRKPGRGGLVGRLGGEVGAAVHEDYLAGNELGRG
jgi:hypothetical protein